MKIHILHPLRDEPWGGGNQFLKALKAEWTRQGVLSLTAEEADVILINSYPFGEEHLFDTLWRIKKMHPEKIVVYRLDGPISFIRQNDTEVDRIIRTWNHLIADGIIFQSSWCEEKNRETFQISSAYQSVIHNAPDPTIFYPSQKNHLPSQRIKLIATSWSANLRKGFDLYTYLDQNLDFSRYEMTFVGNSPVKFTHIKMIEPLCSQDLASLLRTQDLFITASKSDPCSNSLIEALSCGLPAVAINDGGHPELIRHGGELFKDTQDVLEKIDRVANAYASYRAQLPVFDISTVAHRYFDFCENLWLETQKKRYTPKQTRPVGLIKLKGQILTWTIKKNLGAIRKKTHSFLRFSPMPQQRLPHLIRVISTGFRDYRKALIILTLLGFLGSLFEIIGINALIPLLSFVLKETSNEMNLITETTQRVFSFFHVSFGIQALLIFISLLFISKAAVLLFFQYVHIHVITDYESQERSRLLKKMLTAEWSFLSTRKMGYLDQVITQDITCATYVLRDVGRLILILTNLLIYTIVALTISPTITLMTLVTGTLFFFGFKPLFKKTSNTARAFTNDSKRVSHFINQILLGFKSIKTQATLSLVVSQGEQLFSLLKKSRVNLYLYSGLGGIIGEPMIMIFLLLMFAVSYSLPNFNFGVFTVTLYLMHKMFNYVQSAQGKFQTISEYLPHLESSIQHLADAQQHQEQKEGTQPFTFQHTLEFQGVGFKYQDHQDVLTNIQFRIHKGEMIGLIGPSGSGKTTIIDLLLRLLEPTTGSILMDDKPLKTMALDAWRKNIGYVPQDLFLLNESIKENIRFFDERITDQDIQNAATASHLDEFLKNEPNGLETQVGERGIHLSVGQRQRIVLARALVRKPEILILDEATSALDHASEEAVQRTLKKLKGHMTIILIAHRPSTLLDVDRLVTIAHGVTTECGTPTDLLNNPSSYFSQMHHPQRAS